MCGLQDCSVLCHVQSDFSAVELSRFKLKNRHFWNMGEKYYRVDYLIKVALGPVSFLKIPEVESQFTNSISDRRTSGLSCVSKKDISLS